MQAPIKIIHCIKYTIGAICMNWIIGVYFAVVGRNGWIETVCGLCPKTKALSNLFFHPWRKHLISYSSYSHNPYPQWSSMCCEYLNIAFKTLKYLLFPQFLHCHAQLLSHQLTPYRLNTAFDFLWNTYTERSTVSCFEWTAVQFLLIKGIIHFFFFFFLQLCYKRIILGSPKNLKVTFFFCVCVKNILII